MNLREYDAGRDHAEAAAILRSLHARGPVPYTIHPGDWAWWTEHRDPRFRVVNLIGPGALVEVGVDHRYVAAFGLDAKECVELGEHLIGDRSFAVSEVSAADVERHAVLADLGFVPDETMSPLFARANRGGVVGAVLPEGFTIRPLAADEGVARAAAARRRPPAGAGGGPAAADGAHAGAPGARADLRRVPAGDGLLRPGWR
ncbi:MAG: hypothetical protein ACRDV7_01720, partial [Acidimicrobiia bacterium]